MSEYHTGRLRIKKISPDNGWPEHWILLWKFDEHDYWEEFGEAFLTFDAACLALGEYEKKLYYWIILSSMYE